MASFSTKFLCLLVIIGLAVPSWACNNVYNVGDAAGWCQAANLATWVRRYIFKDGDCLRFLPPVSGPALPLYQVDYNTFTYCTGQGVLLADASGSTNYIFPCNQPGIFYFTSNPLDCDSAARLCVTVVPL